MLEWAQYNLLTFFTHFKQKHLRLFKKAEAQSEKKERSNEMQY